MKKFTLLFMLCILVLSLNAQTTQKTIKDSKEDFETFFQAFQKSDDQLSSILKYDSINKYFQKTDFAMWLDVIEKVGQNKPKVQSRGVKSTQSTTIIDSVVADIGEVDEVPFMTVTLAMSYNEDVDCENVEMKFTDSDDSTYVVGEMIIDYNDDHYPTLFTINEADSTGNMVVYATMFVAYENTSDITEVYIKGRKHETGLTDALKVSIDYQSGRIFNVQVYADEDLVLYAEDYVYEWKEDNDSTVEETGEDKLVYMFDAEVSFSDDNELTYFTIAINNLYDSAWVGTRFDFSYQDSKLIQAYESEGFDEDSSWVPLYKETYTFDDKDQISIWTCSDYEDSSASWIVDEKWVYTFDDTLMVERLEYEYLPELDSFAYDNKWEYIYNQQGQLTGRYSMDFDSYNAEWDTNYRYIYDYYDFNKVSAKTYAYYRSYDSTWRLSGLDSFSYDVNQKLVERKDLDYNSNDSIWELDNIDSFYYANDKFIGHFYYDMQDSLVGTDGFMLQRDDAENLSGIEVFEWVDSTGDWETIVFCEVEYDQSIEIPQVELPEYLWDAFYSLTTWFGIDEDLSTITQPNPTSGLGLYGINSVEEIKEQIQINNAPVHISAKNKFRAEFETDIRIYYSEVDDPESFIDEELTLDNTNVKVYPNPAKDFIIIDNSGSGTVKIYNLKGEKIMEQTIEGVSRIDISDMPQGIYTYSIHTGNEENSGKLIIK